MLKKLLLILILSIVLAILLYVSIRSTKNQQRTGESVPANGEVEMVEVVEEREEKEKGDTQYNDIRSIEPSYNTQTEIKVYIREIFKESSDWALRLCYCESKFDPDARNPNGLYFGLFQFDHPTFDRYCEGSIWEWKDQTRCAKKLIDKGETWRWPVCNRIANQ
jgi:hypothetical protein